MALRFGLVLAAGVLAAQVASAQETKLPLSGNDYAVTYRVSPDNATMTQRWAPARGLMRMEVSAQGQEMTGLIEMKSGAMRMWAKSQPGMVMVLDGKPSADRGAPTDRTRTVLGETCRVWKTEGADVCFAADGVPLAFENGGSKAEAVRVDRAAQAASLFAAPKGAKEMKMPAGMGGGMTGPF